MAPGGGGLTSDAAGDGRNTIHLRTASLRQASDKLNSQKHDAKQRDVFEAPPNWRIKPARRVNCRLPGTRKMRKNLMPLT
jgi:hypothetical protein